MKHGNLVLSKEAAQEKLHRMALEIVENISGDDAELILIGIKQNGIVIAEKLNSYLLNYINVQVKIISVSLDKRSPGEIFLSEPVDFNDKNIIVTDDVTNSGRTLLYALKPLLNFHPKRIQTLALVERMHKLFPVKPDYVGLSVATTLQDNILVEVENGEVTGAYIQ